MLKNFKRLIGLALVLVLSVIVTFPTFAEISKDSIDKQVETSQIYSFIQSNYEIDSTCSWTKDTKADEAIPTFDLENNVIGYIFNLFTNGNPTGYIVYDTSTENPIVIEFGYNGVYSIQGQEVTKNNNLGRLKLIRIGMEDYLLQIGDDLYTIDEKAKVTDQKNEYKLAIKEREDAIAKYIEELKKVGLNQTIYKSVSVPNLWKSGYQPVTMQMYGNKGCTVVFGVNLLKYWSVCRGIPSLYNSYDATKLEQTYSRLYSSMKTDSEGNTTFLNGYNGIVSYCSTYACTKPKGSDYRDGLNWDWYKTQISNGNFMCVNAEVKHYQNDGRPGNHSFSGVGYQETSDGNFMRVGDQWTTDYSHFYNVSAYSGSIKNIWYYRW